MMLFIERHLERGVSVVAYLMIAAVIFCTFNGWGYLIRLSPKRVIKTAIGAWLGFFAIGLVLWGIYSGKFSPTEAAAVTVGFVSSSACLAIR